LKNPKFIKLTDINGEYGNKISQLNICIDSIERFYRIEGISHIYLKGTSSYHDVKETPEEIEALIFA